MITIEKWRGFAVAFKFIMKTTTQAVRDQHPRSHHKGGPGMQTHPAVRVGFELTDGILGSLLVGTRIRGLLVNAMSELAPFLVAPNISHSNNTDVQASADIGPSNTNQLDLKLVRWFLKVRSSYSIDKWFAYQAENLAKESVVRRADGTLFPLNTPIDSLGILGTGGLCYSIWRKDCLGSFNVTWQLDYISILCSILVWQSVS